jgi:sialidase-1
MLPKRSIDCVCLFAAVTGALVTAVPPAAKGAPVGVNQVSLFKAGEDGYFAYRIPTIVQAINGDLLAIVEGRVNGVGDHGNIDLVMKRSSDNGSTWGPLQLIRSEGTNTAGNPAPVVDRLNGNVHLLYSINQNDVRVVSSFNHGQSWTSPRDIHRDVSRPEWRWHVPGPVHGIQLERGPHAGRLVIASDHISTTSGWGSHVLYSDDGGATWQRGGEVNDGTYDGTHIVPNESTAVELIDGRVYLNFRNHGPHANRAWSISSDSGMTFSMPAIDETLVDPQVQGSVLRYSAVDSGDEKNILLFSNPATDTKGDRTHMTVRASFDEGQSWNDGLLIEEGPSAYSDLVKLADGQIGLLYEAGDKLYDEIVFARFGIEAVNPAPFNGIDGDVNQDGAFNVADLSAFIAVWNPTMRYHGGAHSYTHGDLNFDFKSDLFDVFMFRQLLVAEGIPATGLGAFFLVPEPATPALVVWFLVLGPISPLFCR